jgi:hypothetical protein
MAICPEQFLFLQFTVIGCVKVDMAEKYITVVKN